MIRDRSLVYPNRQFGLPCSIDSYWNRDWFSLSFNQATPKEIEVLPWLIALFFVGLPHGAADLAVLRSKKEGRKVWEAFLWYVISMIGVFMIFIFIPAISLIGFIILSIWHFGNSENPRPSEHGISYEHLLLSFAQGGIVIGTPLAVLARRHIICCY